MYILVISQLVGMLDARYVFIAGKKCIQVMSAEIEEGLKGAIIGVISGIIISVFLMAIKSSELISPHYIALFEVVNLVGSIVLIAHMESWGIGYLIGWLFGMGIMSYSGLVESWLVILYFIVGVLILIQKILQKIKEL